MEPLKRRTDWRARLSDEMDRQRRLPGDWGRHDCAIGLAAGVVEALTGTNLARGYRGRYRTPAGAQKILEDAGAEDLRAFVAALLPEIHPSKANVGDIGLIEEDGPLGQALCMIDVSVLIVMTPDGHGHRPRSHLITAFKVG